jgi:N-acetylmuramoyl-L-alanine amidase
MSRMKILIDNGHGNNTPGKRSPDGRLLEWQYAREIAKAVVSRLRNAGYDAELLVTENYDVPLLERVHRANVKCQSLGKENVIVVSVHCNAAGNGKEWLKATGWEIWTSEGMTDSDRLAEWMLRMAELSFPDKIRVWRQEQYQRDKEKNFTILKSTLCPAVLTENFFMDNQDDVAFLLSEEGKKAIVNCHVLGIINYIESL